MPSKLGIKWEMACFNNRLPQFTLLHAGYSMKLKKKKLYALFRLRSYNIDNLVTLSFTNEFFSIIYVYYYVI